MRAETAEVIVVGAGPAGSACASMLGRMGIETALLDRAQFPREKACGDYLTPGAMRRLRQNFPEVAHLPRPLLGFEIQSENGAGWSASFEPGCEAGALRRSVLDAALAAEAVNAGVRFCSETSVLEVNTAGDEILLTASSGGTTSSWRSRWLIAADGYHSRIVRQLGWDQPGGRRRVARVFHLDAPPSGPVVRMFSFSGGAVGIGPLETEANVTVALDAPRGHSAAELLGLAPAIAQAAFHIPERWRPLRPPLSTACGPRRSRHLAGRRVLVIGDAARFVDPFTGEGVYHALAGALLAAEALSERSHPERVYERYSTAYCGELSARYRLSALIHSVIRRPFLRDNVLNALESNARYADRLRDAIADLRPASEVTGPGLAGELVWRCLTALSSPRRRR